MDNESAKRIQGELIAAIQTGDADQLQRLLREYPEYPPAEHWLAPVHAAAARASLEMFRAFVERFPQAKEWDLGHLGNPVGLAAAQGDVQYLKFLLDDLGLKANEGRMMYTPVLHFVSQLDDTRFVNKAEIVNVLKQHGATLEGQGICYQKSHTLSNGKLCWHRGGNPNPPICAVSI